MIVANLQALSERAKQPTIVRMDVNLKALGATLTQTLGWQAITFTAMAGSTSAALFVARSADREAVIRLFDGKRWQESTSSLSKREGSILTALSGAGLPAPELLTTLPDNGVVMTLMPGRVWLPQTPGQAWLHELAGMLTQIHQAPVVVPWVYESWNNFDQWDAVDWWSDRQLWQQCRLILNARPDAETTFIHRDYHPVNLLWQNQKICAVVDWINACMGPAAVDVAHCRLNLALMYGITAADHFLAAYQQMNPTWQYQAFWDIDAAFSSNLTDLEPYPPWRLFGLTGLNEQMIRQRLVAFVASAIDNEPN